MTPSKSHNAPSPLLQKPPILFSTFSDALLNLGFKQAHSQKYEWLTSYPTARPLLEAIKTQFTPECVLTAKQASDYANLTQKQPILPDSELFQAAKLLSSPALSFPDVQQQRRKRLETARKRLKLLSAQRDLLRDQVLEQRQHEQARKSTPSPSAREQSEHVVDLGKLEYALDHWRACLRLNPCSLNMDPSIDMYAVKERLLYDEMLAFAKNNFQIQRPPISYAPASPASLSLSQIVKSYGDIKAQQYMQQVRLLRAKAMLASLTLSQNSPRRQRPMPSVHAFTKDLREKGKHLLDTKAKVIAEQAEEQLMARIQTVLLADTLRRQNHIIETARFFARICLEQRIRILCFSLATSAQEARYQRLFDTLRDLAVLLSHENLPQSHLLSEASIVTPVDLSQMYSQVQSPLDGIDVSTQFSSIEAFEDEIFDAAMQSLSDLLTDFINKIGWEGPWLRLDSHPDYRPLVEELEELLNYNTAILEAVLRKRESHRSIAAQNRSWIKIVNSRP